MNRIPVVSSNISSVGYDSENQILEIEFRESKLVYQYFRVPMQVYNEFIRSDSLGKYFNQKIKDIYRYTQI